MSHDPHVPARPTHSVPLWALFMILLALTAGEVGLFEVWHRTSEHGHAFIPKFAMVLLLLALTLPKAAIVMVYFMHLKFERQLIIALAIAPLLLALGGILAILSDTLALHERAYGRDPALHLFSPHNQDHASPHPQVPAPPPTPASPPNDPHDPFSMAN